MKSKKLIVNAVLLCIVVLGSVQTSAQITQVQQGSGVYTTISTKQIEDKECITTLNGQNNKVEDVLTLSNFPNTQYRTVAKNKNGIVLTNTDKLGTGSTIELLDNTNNVVKTYYILIMGDIDGDGRIRAKDANLLIEYLIDSSRITDKLQLKAADLVDDGHNRIRSTDLNALYRMLAQ